MTYYVPANNWTTIVKTHIGPGNPADGTSLYPINFGTASPDPAVGCLYKTFNASYKCGLETTTRNLTPIQDAVGKTAKFNCSNLVNKCSGSKLYLGDDGILTVKDNSGSTLWSSTEAPINATPLPSDALALDVYKPIKDGVENTDNAMPYKRSFLNSGEYLNIGQYMSSPSGKCRLEMVDTIPPTSGSATAEKTLQVVYTVIGCSVDNPINTQSSTLYTIPWTYRENLGKMGYVNAYGQLQAYTDPTMVGSYSDNFIKLANANGTSYRMYGNDLGQPMPNIATVEDCKVECKTYGATGPDESSVATEQCAGFEYEKIGKTCQLKTDGILRNGIRYISPNNASKNYEYYARSKGVNNVDTSCPYFPEDIVSAETTVWNGIAQGSAMTPTTMCGLQKEVVNDRLQVNIADASLNIIATRFKGTINSLYDKYQTLKNKLLDNKTSLRTKLSNLNETKQDLADWSGEQSEQLDALNEDRTLNMMSQNYKHILWSILAILIIIVVIKISKLFGIADIAQTLDITKAPQAVAAAATAAVST